MRLDKLLSNLKYGSRTEIKKIVKQALVKVNGKIIFDSSFDVKESDEILIEDSLVYHKEIVVLMLNKPSGYVCANTDNLHKTVFELIKEPYNRYDLNVAGRLDIDTEGLVILTNNGDFLHRIISPKHKVYKKYYVKYEGKINKNKLENGVEILDGNDNPFVTEKAMVEELGKNEAYISIVEGKFHQIKRMFEAINCKVVYLKRLEIGEYKLDDLAIGEYKELPTI